MTGYKISKKILNTIKTIKPKKAEKNQFEELLDILESEGKIFEFYEYVNAYYHGMPYLNKDVAKVIREEKIAHKIADAINEDGSNIREAYSTVFRLDDKGLSVPKPKEKAFNYILDSPKKD